MLLLLKMWSKYLSAMVAALLHFTVITGEGICRTVKNEYDTRENLQYSKVCFEATVHVAYEAKNNLCAEMTINVGIYEPPQATSGCSRYDKDGQPVTLVSGDQVTHMEAGERVVCHCSEYYCSIFQYWQGAIAVLLYHTHAGSYFSWADRYCINSTIYSYTQHPFLREQVDDETTTTTTTTEEQTTTTTTTEGQTTTTTATTTTEQPAETSKEKLATEEIGGTAEEKLTTKKPTVTKKRTKTTREELLRKLSLHLVMLSMTMLTLMLCQLVFISKIRNHYRNTPNTKRKHKDHQSYSVSY
ncbi:hypothetical protein Q1695_007768 [Nippostrongylus brasiliensis]|nr:hypothetical protein Q1695_007768 [Nippostrongylus brasiliensis]